MREEFKVGDWVRWKPGQEIKSLGNGPFIVRKIYTKRDEEYLTISGPDVTDSGGWWDWRFELDHFLTAVHKRRHPQ